MKNERNFLILLAVISLVLDLATAPLRWYCMGYSGIIAGLLFAALVILAVVRRPDVRAWKTLIAVFTGWAVLNVPLMFLPGYGAWMDTGLRVVGMIAGYAVGLAVCSRCRQEA